MKYQVVCGYEDLSFESENEFFSEAVVVWAEGYEVAIKGFEAGHEKQAKAYVARQLKKYDEKGVAASAGVFVVKADEVAEAKKFFDDHFKIVVVN